MNVPWVLHDDPAPQVRRWPDDEDVDVLSLSPLQAQKVRRDGVLGWEMEIDALPLTFTSDRSEFSVAVLAGESKDVTLDDDRGASIEVRELDEKKWRVRWIPDLAAKDARCCGTFRLAVRGRVSLTSRPFVLECDSTPEQCAR